MKKVVLTNATIIPFYKQNMNDKDEVLRIITPKATDGFTSYIATFNVETFTTWFVAGS